MPAKRLPQRQQQIAQELREIYGGSMTLIDIARELGFAKVTAARKFIGDAPAVRVNRRLRWRVGEVAKKIYENEETPMEEVFA